MSERFAIYYAPSATGPLWDRAASWLGRDPASGELLEGPIAGIERTALLNRTQSAGRYGFHATIKPPMALASDTDLAGLRVALADFAREARPVEIGPLVLADLDGFLALVPAEQSAELTDFAARVVEHFDPFRAPPTDKEREQRLASGLSLHQQDLLDRFGYPYVMDQFRFHMTLTDRLEGEDKAEMTEAARTWFAPDLGDPLVLDRLCLYHEPERGQAFRRLEDIALGG